MRLILCFCSLILTIYGKSIVDNLRSKYDIEQIDGSNKIEESNLADKGDKKEGKEDENYKYTICDDNSNEPTNHEIRKEEGSKDERKNKEDKFTYTVCDEDNTEKSTKTNENNPTQSAE